MPTYVYRALDGEGRRVQGKVEADDSARAVYRLRERGLYVIHLHRWRPVRGVLFPRRPRVGGGRIPVKALALFCRQFGTMIGAGVPVLKGLQLLARQSSSATLRQVLQEVATELEAGHTLASALARQSPHLPSILINMTAAGEMGGILEEVFARLGDHFEKEHAVTEKVRSALAYPVVVLVLAIGVVIFMLAFVVPNFMVLFETLGTDLPLPTLMLLGMSGFVRRNLFFLLGGVVAAALAVRHYLRTERGTELADRAVLRIPAVGQLVLKRSLARLCRTLSTLLSSGVPILVALQVVQVTVGNRVVAATVGHARAAVLDGAAMSGPLRASPIIPPMVAEMVVVGEETGQVESMLIKVAEFYEREIDALVERFGSIVQPLIMAGLGIGIGFVLVAMVMPMFEVFGMIQ